MAEDDAANPRSRLFTVRIWSEPVGVGVDRRGSVRDAESGAFRSFREWSDLTSFLAEQLNENLDRCIEKET
jgi:hypothetical protein